MSNVFGGVAFGFSWCRHGLSKFLLEGLGQAQCALRVWLANHIVNDKLDGGGEILKTQSGTKPQAMNPCLPGTNPALVDRLCFRRETREGSRKKAAPPPPPANPLDWTCEHGEVLLCFHLALRQSFYCWQLIVVVRNVHAMFCMQATRKTTPAKVLDSVVITKTMKVAFAHRKTPTP